MMEQERVKRRLVFDHFILAKLEDGLKPPFSSGFGLAN